MEPQKPENSLKLNIVPEKPAIVEQEKVKVES